MGPSGDFHEQTATTYAAGVFALCEFFATIVFEWKWIWGIQHWWSKFNAIKVVYLLAKYLGFASQLSSIAIVTLIYRGDGPTIAGCAYWVWVQLTAQWLLWTCLEALLMLRLYALYSRSKFMGIFLFTFMFAETAVAAYLSFSRLHQNFPRVHYGVALPVPPWLFAVDEGVCFHNVKKGIPMQAVYFGCVVRLGSLQCASVDGQSSLFMTSAYFSLVASFRWSPKSRSSFSRSRAVYPRSRYTTRSTGCYTGSSRMDLSPLW
ncbi:uncharacterized protein SCHCODRAFT_02511627 [Schizophyllum commune H4-8]|uniref:uncharacterized protein n=1 Tax=Schizophyllum commune (strain H4-8 / FGSC 9210) TaxID=578458 RepID=UPI002160A077|nr:uncharacterized protein SCHCODRAFT_02511627 [Schizophyllum commune H4-8]KAI5889317.1 hypothetical protein SCHCODRAFT_02511627 [Schizophyllum commune H4-8]